MTIFFLYELEHVMLVFFFTCTSQDGSLGESRHKDSTWGAWTHVLWLTTYELLNVKKSLCDYGQSNYVIAIQLSQDLSRGWMVIHAKFQKISLNSFWAMLIQNFWVGRLVWVVALSEFFSTFTHQQTRSYDVTTQKIKSIGQSVHEIWAFKV